MLIPEHAKRWFMSKKNAISTKSRNRLMLFRPRQHGEIGDESLLNMLISRYAILQISMLFR